MNDFKRHLPHDTSLMALHVSLGRIWDALEAQTGATANAPVRTQALGASASVTSPSGSSAAHHNTLLGIQGGDVDNYYHLTRAEWIGTGTGVVARQDSPAFTGTPTAPTPATADSSTTLATTAFVKSQGYATGTNWGIQKAVVDVAENMLVDVNYQHHILKSFTVYGTMTVNGESYVFDGVN